MDFKDVLFEANLNPRTAAKFLDVSQRTIHRWIKNGAPTIAWRALELRAGTDPHWPGFRIDGKYFYRHDGRRFTRDELINYEYTMLIERRAGYDVAKANYQSQKIDHSQTDAKLKTISPRSA